MIVACVFMLAKAAALFSVGFPLSHDMSNNVICVTSEQKWSQQVRRSDMPS